MTKREKTYWVTVFCGLIEVKPVFNIVTDENLLTNEPRKKVVCVVTKDGIAFKKGDFVTALRSEVVTGKRFVSGFREGVEGKIAEAPEPPVMPEDAPDYIKAIFRAEMRRREEAKNATT